MRTCGAAVLWHGVGQLIGEPRHAVRGCSRMGVTSFPIPGESESAREQNRPEVRRQFPHLGRHFPSQDSRSGQPGSQNGGQIFASFWMVIVSTGSPASPVPGT